MHASFQSEILNEKVHLEDLAVDEKLILKLIMKKEFQDVDQIHLSPKSSAKVYSEHEKSILGFYERQGILTSSDYWLLSSDPSMWLHTVTNSMGLSPFREANSY
jgi:hypothetical protein